MPKGAKAPARKRSTKRAAPKRRKRTVAATKRKRTIKRRRRNPAKLDMKSTALAVVGGAVVGGANYALDGVEKITNKQQAFGLTFGGLVLGIVAGMASKPLGLGIAGAAIGLGGYKLAGIYVQKSANGEASMGQIARGYGPRAMAAGYTYPQMQGTYAEMSAVQANLSAVEADLGAVEADLGEVFADLG
jgi:hypothetical protein